MHLFTRNVNKRVVLLGLTPSERLAARTVKDVSPNGCWVWTGHKTKGYGRMTVAKKGVLVHRLSFELTYGKPPPDMDVLHTCDNPACVRPDHLFLGTDADNMADKTAKGRQAKGMTHANSKLTDEDVRELRRLYRKNVYGLTKKLAARYMITTACVRQIVSGSHWKHVGD